MNSRFYIFLLASAFIISSGCSREGTKAKFSFKENTQGIELLDNGKPVFFYQRIPKALAGRYICNNYLHPLYSLNGDTLTEESPADHLFHRGIFWAWHQLYIGNQRLGDGWVMDSISQDVVNVQTTASKTEAVFNLDINWKSSVFQNGNPFLAEHTIITVHPAEADIRKIDFKISLKPLVAGVQIGGSDDEKGYGGFCTRIKLTQETIFTSDKGPVKPQNLQLVAGPWMDFSGPTGKDNKELGLAILCHPGNPNYPSPWILRQSKSMQNAVWPGRPRVELSMDKPVLLRFRLIIHTGNAGSIDLPKLQAEYGKI